MKKKLILVTGAAGGVASMVRPILRADYRLRLSDVQPIPKPLKSEEVVQAALTDAEALRKAVRGVDGIIHLGGYSREIDWKTIYEANIVGAYNLYDAAKAEGVKRIVFASSNHAMGFYPRSEKIPVDKTVRPDTRYGLSKAFGEALGSLYADKYGAEILSIRIGHVGLKPANVRDLSIWISPRDLSQLFRIGLEHPKIRHEIVYGMSNNKRAWWDNANARRLGYRPQDKAESYAKEVLAVDNGISGDPRVDLNQGGIFCTAESF
jgi:uronate dehydrogenase